jgi:hypothetical protein
MSVIWWNNIFIVCLLIENIKMYQIKQNFGDETNE